MSQPIIHPLDPVYFGSMPENRAFKIIKASIFHKGTDQIFQPVHCYVTQDEEGDWSGDSWHRIVYTQVEIKIPLLVDPGDIKTDVECALDEAGIDYQSSGLSIDWRKF